MLFSSGRFFLSSENREANFIKLDRPSSQKAGEKSERPPIMVVRILKCVVEQDHPSQEF